MPSSETDGEVPGQTLATVAETLYLANLLLVPGVAFAGLLWLYWRHAGSAPPLARWLRAACPTGLGVFTS